MKILLVSPWRNRWVDYMKRWFEAHGHELQWTDSPKPIAFLRWADIVVFGWANEHAEQLTALPFKFIPYVCFIRSYELLENCPARKVHWDKIDRAIFVNPAMGKLAEAQGISLPLQKRLFIPNAVDLEEWPLQPHGPGKNLAFVADLSFKKGLQLLAQVFMALPKSYHLHLAGERYVTSRRDVDSFLHILTETGVVDRVHFHGRVENLQEWFKDKDYIISTSPIEGCPNNVLEAMACGIKPVIYSWPGAVELFRGYPDPGDFALTFRTVQEAVGKITDSSYEAAAYRAFVESRFSPDLVYGALLKELENLLSLHAAKAGQEVQVA